MCTADSQGREGCMITWKPGLRTGKGRRPSASSQGFGKHTPDAHRPYRTRRGMAGDAASQAHGQEGSSTHVAVKAGEEQSLSAGQLHLGQPFLPPHLFIVRGGVLLVDLRIRELLGHAAVRKVNVGVVPAVPCSVLVQPVREGGRDAAPLVAPVALHGGIRGRIRGECRVRRKVRWT